MGMKTFQDRLYPSQAQERQIFKVLDVCRHFYNMCLEDRKLAYQFEKRSVSKSEQEKTAIRYRQTFPQAKIVFSQTLQTVVDDLDKAFQSFFRRVKAHERKPGYPRFKGCNRFHSFAFKQFGVGAKLDGRRLKLFGIGRVPVRWHRPIEGDIKTVRIVHKAGRWYACFACEVPDKPELPKTGRAIGIDVGIASLITSRKARRSSIRSSTVRASENYGYCNGHWRGRNQAAKTGRRRCCECNAGRNTRRISARISPTS